MKKDLIFLGAAVVIFVVCVFIPGVLRRIKTGFSKKATAVETTAVANLSKAKDAVASAVDSAAAKVSSDIKKD